MSKTDATTLLILKKALAEQKAGRVESAESLYKRVLAAEPDNADAHHLLGLCALSRGSLSTALAYMSRAIALKPEVPAFHNNLANVLMSAGGVVQARLCFEYAPEPGSR